MTSYILTDRVLDHASSMRENAIQHAFQKRDRKTPPARIDDDLSYEDRVPFPSACPRFVHVIQTEDIAVHEFVGEDVICVVLVYG